MTSTSTNKNNFNIKHILFIVENNTVPTDIRVWREANTARQAGYMVSIIAPKDENYSRPHEVINDIEIFRHPVFNQNSGILATVKEYLNAFLWEILIATRLYFTKPFHILHAANPPDNIFLVALFFRLFGVKFIFDHHDIAPELFTSKFGRKNRTIFYMLRLLEKLSCKTADCIISTNSSYKDHIINLHGVNPDKIKIVRNDPEIGMCPETAQRPSDNLIKLLYVGSINTQDGVDHIVRAIHHLVYTLEQKNIFCSIVGDGESLEDIRLLARQLSVDYYIDFTGFIHDRTEVINYISNADICLESASNNDANKKSTFIKIMEYMACSKPIVAYDLAETRFSVGSGGILVPPGNFYAFSEAISDLVNDIEKRRILGAIAQERIINGLNWESSATKLLESYSAVLKNCQHTPNSS